MSARVPRWIAATTIAGQLTALGCASLPTEAPLVIEGLVFMNEASAADSEASLRIEATHEFVSCGYIPVRGECSTTFPLREYRRNSVRLAWKQGDRSFLTAPFVVSPPQTPIAGKPAKATVILRDAGQFSARLAQ